MPPITLSQGTTPPTPDATPYRTHDALLPEYPCDRCCVWRLVSSPHHLIIREPDGTHWVVANTGDGYVGRRPWYLPPTVGESYEWVEDITMAAGTGWPNAHWRRKKQLVADRRAAKFANTKSPGRPSMDPGLRRERALGTYLNTPEMDEFCALAKEAGMSPGLYLRTVIETHMARKRT